MATQSSLMCDEPTVRSNFANLEHGDGGGFFVHVADDVD
ncbi:hypothetical protein DEV91_10954 [Phyllobacterium brassicacearum]|nr:hypothetical protein DEV91_10954 [Phyllobacterium brassicacearum]